MRNVMPLLDTLNQPKDLLPLSLPELRRLAGEIRAFLIEQVSRTGGHLGSNLGVVELTLAVHRVFESPYDRVIWDTGHQAYVHKILTGRREGFARLRQGGGMSGYPQRTESEHDLVENSHASTALSYADGFARADRLRGEAGRTVVAVVGDGSLTGGMAWEALNNLSAQPDLPVVIVLNDNGRSYAPTVGAVAEHLRELRVTGAGRTGRNLFEGLGLAYVGPVDGHDIEAVETALRRARALRRPVVVHCVTQKGRGHPAAENHRLDHLHTVPAALAARRRPTWTSEFSAEMVAIGARRDDVVALTAAMLEPTGLLAFATAYPGRCFDVGIAEQHAVTCATGLAMAGLRPIVAIYSTFLNRAFDQVIMDAALHRCPVTFVLDRAGVTGDDGPSHNGMWDLSILHAVPGLRIAAPRDGASLRALLREALTFEDGPSAVRFPKGPLPENIPACDMSGDMDVLRRRGAHDVLIVAVGATAAAACQAADLLTAHGVGVTVVDPRWIKPVDPALAGLALAHRAVVTVEDSGRAGGAGSAGAQALRDEGVLTPVREVGLPRRFLRQGARGDVLGEHGLTGAGIADAAMEVLGHAAAGTPAPPKPVER
jgi:1-deoxy-D-xylulose-5-phosphate synthase